MTVSEEQMPGRRPNRSSVTLEFAGNPAVLLHVTQDEADALMAFGQKHWLGIRLTITLDVTESNE